MYVIQSLFGEKSPMGLQKRKEKDGEATDGIA